MIRIFGAASLSLALLTACGVREKAPEGELTLTLEDGEKWWVGVISESHRMPLEASSDPFEIDLFGNTAGNQVQPLLLSTNGRYVWSEEPFHLAFREGTITLRSERGPLSAGQSGSTLREAALHAGETFFPPSGRVPDEGLFTHPQFNTWIELTYDQNQEDILAYARGIVDNGFAPGVLMIDEGWFEEYGRYVFHPGRFPDPKGMMDELHAMGFRVNLDAVDQELIVRAAQTHAWKGEDGSLVEGPATLEVDAPLERLPWYLRVTS